LAAAAATAADEDDGYQWLHEADPRGVPHKGFLECIQQETLPPVDHVAWLRLVAALVLVIVL